jgi:hypothetical protein
VTWDLADTYPMKPSKETSSQIQTEMVQIPAHETKMTYVTKSLLVWLQASFVRWSKEDDSARNQQWVEGIVEAFQNALAGTL